MSKDRDFCEIILLPVKMAKDSKRPCRLKNNNWLKVFLYALIPQGVFGQPNSTIYSTY